MMIMMIMMCTDQLTRPQSSFMLFVIGHGMLAEDYYGFLANRTMGRKEWEMKETPFHLPQRASSTPLSH